LYHKYILRICLDNLRVQGHGVNLKVTVAKQRQRAGLCSSRTQFNLFCFVLLQSMSYVDHVTEWLNEQTCDGTVKRRRRVSRRQRVAANDRERRRMRQLNAAFDRLRQQIPAPAQSSAHSHRPLSRIQTLRLAIDYIAFMMDTLDRSASASFLSAFFVLPSLACRSGLGL